MLATSNRQCLSRGLLSAERAKQSAYKQYLSTETAITIVHNDIVRAIDAGNISALVVLDLSAAFDTVDRDVLLDVLSKWFGVASNAFDWCKLRLSERTQSFCVTSGTSNSVKLTCSIPQGSMIGPVKCIAYTEEIVETVDAFRINHHFYADDTLLQDHMRTDTIQANRPNLELCIDAIKEWCSSLRLQLNGDKTEIIWFGSRANLKKLSSADTTLRIGSTIVEPVNSVRNLGVYMASELSMRTHIDKVSSACFYHLCRLRLPRYAVSESTM